mmetsp:Transcript_20364/g.64843  ORF Transcript_20364/g.64843 Transcript_20364/m.64843 type:complete len:287 (+) Transcript_20364:85-945(+)
MSECLPSRARVERLTTTPPAPSSSPGGRHHTRASLLPLRLRPREPAQRAAAAAQPLLARVGNVGHTNGLRARPAVEGRLCRRGRLRVLRRERLPHRAGRRAQPEASREGGDAHAVQRHHHRRVRRRDAELTFEVRRGVRRDPTGQARQLSQRLDRLPAQLAEHVRHERRGRREGQRGVRPRADERGADADAARSTAVEAAARELGQQPDVRETRGRLGGVLQHKAAAAGEVAELCNARSVDQPGELRGCVLRVERPAVEERQHSPRRVSIHLEDALPSGARKGSAK